MQIVHHAADPIQAHLVRHALEAEGIVVFVLGESLLGGVGELPAGSFIQLAVPESQVQAAQAVLRELPMLAGEPAAAVSDEADAEDGLSGAAGLA